MSHPLEVLPVGLSGSIVRATVSFIDDEHGHVIVQLPGTRGGERPCLVLSSGGASPILQAMDEVLLWNDGSGAPVVLGRVAAYEGGLRDPSQARASEAHVDRPRSLLLEAEGEIVLRNRHARLRLGADGEVELVCNGLSARSRRWLRLLGSVIHLN